jgi:hypothetical protein
MTIFQNFGAGSVVMFGDGGFGGFGGSLGAAGFNPLAAGVGSAFVPVAAPAAVGDVAARPLAIEAKPSGASKNSKRRREQKRGSRARLFAAGFEQGREQARREREEEMRRRSPPRVQLAITEAGEVEEEEDLGVEVKKEEEEGE